MEWNAAAGSVAAAATSRRGPARKRSTVEDNQEQMRDMTIGLRGWFVVFERREAMMLPQSQTRSMPRKFVLDCNVIWNSRGIDP
jgi:AMMECR1 domain-containing protein